MTDFDHYRMRYFYSLGTPAIPKPKHSLLNSMYWHTNTQKYLQCAVSIQHNLLEMVLQKAV